ncbi:MULTISPECIES: DUF202 domain-containing protein [unclassified Microbacterium]|uniref:DUF202 domain-containing protein n=1 Tax=unclassified Microbacterium TaxID=2609290 RepID=UPI0025E4BB3D|nr:MULTISPECIES: DUF202 domain-containing protein [unclassified Microbacterium]
MGDDLYDPGLQPERTELAWRRTALSIAVGSVVAMRLLPTALGSEWWILPGITGVVFAVVLWQWSRRRYVRVSHATVTARDHRMIPDGALLLTLAVFAALVGALGIAVLLVLPLS